MKDDKTSKILGTMWKNNYKLSETYGVNTENIWNTKLGKQWLKK
jgi:phosphoribosyl-AMP cyclohydrolase